MAENWQNLARVTLVAIIIFNRRRAGEAERLLVSDYERRNKNPLGIQDIAESLSEVERLLCTTMTRIEIRGKRGRTEPMILTPQLIKDELQTQHC
jgi:hypothetical protein